MGYHGVKSVALFLLVINLILYIFVSATSGWAINYGIEETPLESGYDFFIPVRLFPMYFPMGNMATGFFVLFSLIAGVVGIASSLSGINNVRRWNLSNLHAASSSAIITWSLTLLAMGVACKEINIGWPGSSLRTLEALMIVSSGTQLFCVGAIQAGIKDFISPNIPIARI